MCRYLPTVFRQEFFFIPVSKYGFIRRILPFLLLCLAPLLAHCLLQIVQYYIHCNGVLQCRGNGWNHGCFVTQISIRPEFCPDGPRLHRLWDGLHSRHPSIRLPLRQGHSQPVVFCKYNRDLLHMCMCYRYRYIMTFFPNKEHINFNLFYPIQTKVQI